MSADNWAVCPRCRDRAKAEVILDRTADRLAGYTHEEVAEMHPLPEVKPR